MSDPLESESIVSPEAEAVLDPEHESIPKSETPASTGQLLRAARLASGMHIGTLSMALKVPVKKLDALESDDWEQLPDAVFARALIASICRQIKVDSAPILASLPKVSNHTLAEEGLNVGLNQQYIPPTDMRTLLSRLSLSMPMLLGSLVILLGALVMIFLPDFYKQSERKKVEALTPNPQIIVSVAPPAASMPPQVASAPSTMPVVPVTSSAALKVVAKGAAWIQIKDNKGAVLVQRTLQPKEAISASGSPPLAIVIGRIDEIESITVRGKPFNLSNLSTDNVARFEVN